MSPTVSFHLASDTFFLQSYGPPVSRLGLPVVTVEMAAELRSSMQTQLMGSPVSLAVDGWTNWRHVNTFNLA